jgi:hypothetical protein
MKPGLPAGTTCRERTEKFPLSLPNEDPEEKSADRMKLRAEFQLNSSTLVRVYELRFPSDDGAYNSTVTISGGSGDQRFSIPTLIRGGEGLRLVRASVICDQSNQASLILGFEAGWAGAVQGFVTVQHSAGKLQVQGLPIVRFGKLVVSRKAMEDVTLWSAEAEDQGACDACEKPYVIRDCHLDGQGWTCTKRPKQTAPFNPNVVTSDIIEIK